MNEFEVLSDGVRGELGAQRTAQQGGVWIMPLCPAPGCQKCSGGDQLGERGKNSVCVCDVSVCHGDIECWRKTLTHFTVLVQVSDYGALITCVGGVLCFLASGFFKP